MATVNDRDNWLAERRTGLGGSDIAKVFGLSKWGTEVDVWLDKKGLAADKPESEAMMLGTALEPYVANRFSKEVEKGLIEYQPMIHGDGENSFALGNLDRIVVEPMQDVNDMLRKLSSGDLSCIESILECKTATRMDDWHDEFGNFIVPEYYRCQVLHYLGLVPSAKRIYVAVYYTGLTKGFEWGVIERDDSLISKMFAVEREWWNKHIVGNEMPDANNKAEVVELFPASVEDSTKAVTKDIALAITRYNDAKDRYNKAEVEKEAAEDEIALFLGEKEAIVSEDGKMVYATFKSSRDTVRDVTDWEAVAKQLASSVFGGEELLKDIVAKNTVFGKVTRKGGRPLKVFPEPKEVKSKNGKAKA
jgi:putative phage-type endonuclease